MEGGDPNQNSQKFAVYVHYDENNLIADHVISQTQALSNCGYRVLFVSSSPKFLDNEIAKLKSHTFRLAHRKNVGHDFGSYKDGVCYILDGYSASELILMNDSCYGPLYDFTVLEQRASASPSDVFGVTESWESTYHLQSYFLHFGQKILSSKEFKAFWRRLKYFKTRHSAIYDGEIGLSQFFLSNGFRLDAYCPYHAVAAKQLSHIRAILRRKRRPLTEIERQYFVHQANSITIGAKLNPTHSFWEILVRDFECPFIKRSLLRDNPVKIPALNQWEQVLAGCPNADIPAIREHLKRANLKP